MSGVHGEDAARWRDLEQRLSDHALHLSVMADDSSHQDERLRLRAKAEGLDLALSFVQEVIRTEQFGSDRQAAT